MSWIYRQSTGELLHNEEKVGTGYSGHGEGKNNPDKQSERGVGPLPRGIWHIEGLPFNSPEHGPYALRLVPAFDTQTFGRSGFLIHGDSKEHPGEASLGCVILQRVFREKIWNSGDRVLEAVA